jgi:hypothetical protein
MRFLYLVCFVSQVAIAQFAPPQGQIGSTAMHKDSTAFVAWATSCKITRGLQDISNVSSGYATVGDSSSALNISDGNVISLGDGGYAICKFQNEIYNGSGFDFAVFENSFDGNYLEFAFVEVSSDGDNFFRFPATSNTQDTLQTGAFAYSDATKTSNLAGKYITQYGTPFDLNDLQGISGLDINHITHIKIIDVVGSITTPYATYDKNNNKVNDPWPTPYPSSGFDLDAVGVINQQLNNSVKDNNNNNQFVSVYPNPAKEVVCIKVDQFDNSIINYIEILDVSGKCIIREVVNSSYCQINTSDLNNGFYFLQLKNNSTCLTKKISIAK